MFQHQHWKLASGASHQFWLTCGRFQGQTHTGEIPETKSIAYVTWYSFWRAAKVRHESCYFWKCTGIGLVLGIGLYT